MRHYPEKNYTGIGSRQTPAGILVMMTELAVKLRGKDFILRSGGADGADYAFEAGAGSLKNIYLPWPKFNGSDSSLVRPKKGKTTVTIGFVIGGLMVLWLVVVLVHAATFNQERYDKAEAKWGPNSDWRERSTAMSEFTEEVNEWMDKAKG